MVREGVELKSAQTSERLSTGATIEELALVGERLNYKLLEGTGPAEGWVSLKVSGKEIVTPAAAGPADPADWPATHAAAVSGGPVETTIRAAGPVISPVGKPAGKARMRLVIFPWTGNRGGAGAMNNFMKWGKTLNEAIPETWEICQANYPGRGTRGKEANHLDAVASATEQVDALEKAGSCPTVFLGFSFGAIIAYEAAQLMAKRGQQPLGVVVVSAEHPGWDGRKAGAGAGGSATKDMSDDDFEKMLHEKGGTEAILTNPDMKKMFMPVIKSDMIMEEAYGSAPPEHPKLACPVLVFRGKECPIIPRAEVDPWMEVTGCGEGTPTRVEELSSGLKPAPEMGQPWLSDWYLLQGEASQAEILKTLGSNFGGVK